MPAAPHQPHCRTCACHGHGPDRWINAAVQLVGLLAAVAFGVWAPLSWQLSRIANLEAQTSNLNAKIANQLSIIDFCISNEAYKDAPVCRAALRNSNVLLDDMVYEYCRPMADMTGLARGYRWEQTMMDMTEAPKTTVGRYMTDAVPQTWGTN